MAALLTVEEVKLSCKNFEDNIKKQAETIAKRKELIGKYEENYKKIKELETQQESVIKGLEELGVSLKKQPGEPTKTYGKRDTTPQEVYDKEVGVVMSKLPKDESTNFGEVKAELLKKGLSSPAKIRAALKNYTSTGQKAQTKYFNELKD